MSLCERGHGACSCETAPGAGQRQSGGKGRGLGLGHHLPGCSVIDEPFCEPSADSQPVVGEWNAPAGACWKWDPGAAC